MSEMKTEEHVWVQYMTDDAALKEIAWCRNCGAHYGMVESGICPLAQKHPDPSYLHEMMDEIFRRCHIVLWPKDGGYPIEHQPHIKKDSRDQIEKELGYSSSLEQEPPHAHPQPRD